MLPESFTKPFFRLISAIKSSLNRLSQYITPSDAEKTFVDAELVINNTPKLPSAIYKEQAHDDLENIQTLPSAIYKEQDYDNLDNIQTLPSAIYKEQAHDDLENIQTLPSAINQSKESDADPIIYIQSINLNDTPNPFSEYFNNERFVGGDSSLFGSFTDSTLFSQNEETFLDKINQSHNNQYLTDNRTPSSMPVVLSLKPVSIIRSDSINFVKKAI